MNNEGQTVRHFGGGRRSGGAKSGRGEIFVNTDNVWHHQLLGNNSFLVMANRHIMSLGDLKRVGVMASTCLTLIILLASCGSALRYNDVASPIEDFLRFNFSDSYALDGSIVRRSTLYYNKEVRIAFIDGDPYKRDIDQVVSYYHDFFDIDIVDNPENANIIVAFYGITDGGISHAFATANNIVNHYSYALGGYSHIYTDSGSLHRLYDGPVRPIEPADLVNLGRIHTCEALGLYNSYERANQAFGRNNTPIGVREALPPDYHIATIFTGFSEGSEGYEVVGGLDFRQRIELCLYEEIGHMLLMWPDLRNTGFTDLFVDQVYNLTDKTIRRSNNRLRIDLIYLRNILNLYEEYNLEHGMTREQVEARLLQ